MGALSRRQGPMGGSRGGLQATRLREHVLAAAGFKLGRGEGAQDKPVYAGLWFSARGKPRSKPGTVGPVAGSPARRLAVHVCVWPSHVGWQERHGQRAEGYRPWREKPSPRAGVWVQARGCRPCLFGAQVVAWFGVHGSGAVVCRTITQFPLFFFFFFKIP